MAMLCPILTTVFCISAIALWKEQCHDKLKEHYKTEFAPYVSIRNGKYHIETWISVQWFQIGCYGYGFYCIGRHYLYCAILCKWLFIPAENKKTLWVEGWRDFGRRENGMTYLIVWFHLATLFGSVWVWRTGFSGMTLSLTPDALQKLLDTNKLTVLDRCLAHRYLQNTIMVSLTCCKVKHHTWDLLKLYGFDISPSTMVRCTPPPISANDESADFRKIVLHKQIKVIHQTKRFINIHLMFDVLLYFESRHRIWLVWFV